MSRSFKKTIALLLSTVVLASLMAGCQSKTLIASHQRGVLGRQQQPAPQRQDILRPCGRRGRRCVVSDRFRRRRLWACWQRLGYGRNHTVAKLRVALLGQHLDLLETQLAQGGDLLGRSHPEITDGKRVLHPTQIQLDIHANSQLADIDKN